MKAIVIISGKEGGTLEMRISLSQSRAPARSSCG